MASRHGRLPPSSVWAGNAGDTPTHENFLPRLSRSAASSSSTVASSTSKFSLSTSFIDLSAADIAFFDHVIDLLPTGADDFASLKRAYNRIRSVTEHVVDDEKDAELWDTLLKLIKVRGKDWASRWDAVRMALGLEPRIGSESEREAESEIEDEALSGSETVRDRQERRSSSSAGRNQTSLSAKNEIEALRRRMAALTAEAGSLAGSITERARRDGQGQPEGPRKPILAKEKSKSTGPERHLRFADMHIDRRSHKAAAVESASDEEAPPLPSVLQRTVTRTKATADRPSVAQRQFDEVVARSRSERDAQKRAQEEHLEAQRESRLLPLLSRAHDASLKALLHKCFSWWRTSLMNRRNRERQALRLRNGLVVAKALSAWRGSLRRRRERMRGAVKVDIVRCKLRAWRVWTRAMQESRLTRREEKRSILKGAFLLTRKRMEERIVRDAFLYWKNAIMSRRTVRFRTQHLVRGAFSLWRLRLWQSNSLREKEVSFRDRREMRTRTELIDRWSDATRNRRLLHLAQAFRRQNLLQRTMNAMVIAREQIATDKRRQALAQRWESRRTKKRALGVWIAKAEEIRKLHMMSDNLLERRLSGLKSTTIKIWLLREREQLLLRVKAAKLRAAFLSRWTERHQRLSFRLTCLEAELAEKRKRATLQNALAVWREVTSQTISSQYLASERDRRKRKRETLLLWRENLARRQQQCQRAQVMNTVLLKQKVWQQWMRMHLEAKRRMMQQQRNLKAVSIAFTYWKARSNEKRQEMLAVGLMRSKIETRIRKNSLQRWTNAVIERRSRLLEASERRGYMLVQLAWSKWIDACVRHEDLLSLSNSFLDVKKEGLVRRTMFHWLSFARAERSRRERMQEHVIYKHREVAEKTFDHWYDRHVERGLQHLEYEALLQRQQSAKAAIFTRWKSRTKSLPAVRLDRARTASHAFYWWRERLPAARRQNRALKHDRLTMLTKGFQHWLAITKAKRALRAAARFGGPSAARLGALSHFRHKSGSSPFGKGASGLSSSPRPASFPRPHATSSLRMARRRSLHRAAATMDAAGSKAAAALEQEQEISLRDSDLLVGSSDRGPQREPSTPALPTPRAALSSAFQRWVQDVGARREEMPTFDDLEASSEPPSSVLEYRQTQRRRHATRTPSPPASQAQSEETLRIKMSPRRRPHIEASSSAWLRSKRIQPDARDI